MRWSRGYSGAVGRIRIIAGRAKGRRISVPKRGVRPTSEKVRGAVFDILGDLQGARVIDLFAGSGALGLEALSRGAAACVFVERDPKVVQLIEANLENTGLEEYAQVLRQDLTRGLPGGVGDFDLLLCDPPYGFRGWGPLLGGLAKVLVPGGWAVVEHDAERLLDLPPGLVEADRRQWGSTAVTFFERKEQSNG